MTDTAPPTTDSVSRIEFETAMFRQEHRLLSILKNYFIERPKLPLDDPRRGAIMESLLWRIAVAMTPAAAAGGAGFVAVLGVLIAYWANTLITEQNKLLEVQNTKFDLQTELLKKQNLNLETQNQLSEASRRAVLLDGVLAVLEEAETFIQAEELAKRPNPKTGWILPDRLAQKVAAISRGLKPYQYVQPKRAHLEDFRSFDHFTLLRADWKNQIQRIEGELSVKSLTVR